MKKNFINKGLYQKIVGLTFLGVVLYSTGVLSVLGGFWRTLTPGLFDTPSDASIFGYGYGYSSEWGYGYGYGYGYDFGYGYGYENSNSDPYFAAGYQLTSSGGATLGAGTSTSSSSVTISGTNINTVFAALGVSTGATVYEVAVQPTVISQLETPVTISGYSVTLDIPTGLKIYSTSGSSITILNTGATVTSSQISGVNTVSSALELGDPNVVLVFDQYVTVTIANVGTSVNLLAYKLSGQSTWTTGSISTSACTPAVGGECGYLSGSDLIIRTYHFTTFAAATASTSSSSSSSSSGGGGGGGGSISNILGTTVASGSNVTTQEISTVETQIDKLTVTTKGITVNGVSVSIETPKFTSSTDQKAIEALNKIVLETISKKKITGTDLEKAIEYYNKVLGAVKLSKDGGDSTASKVAAYYMSEFNKIVTAYNDITPSKKLKDAEFEYALAMMNKNGLTKYTSVDAYRPNDSLTRQEAAKFFVEFAKKVLGKSSNVALVATNCEFTDLAKVDVSLKPYITEACKLGLLKGSNGKFLPLDKMTKAQAVAVLVRAIVGKSLDETTIPWFKNYYEKAKELGLTKEKSITGLDKNLTRYEAGLMLYRSNK